MGYATLEQLVNEIGELRPIGAVASQILRITENDRFSAHELATVISSDQALTSKMLRLSNSAYYGFPRRIMTVRDAVVLLGFRAVRSATLASCVIEAARGGGRIDYQTFWHFSVTVGMLAEVVGRAEHSHQDEAFTAGVVHNIGRLALDQHLPQALDDAVRCAAEAGLTVHEAEREVLGFTDAELGGALALHWSFPEPLAEAVAHHVGGAEPRLEPRSLAAVVVRARRFAHSRGLSDGVEPPSGRAAAREWLQPPVSTALRRAGGVEGLLTRVEAFLESSLA